MDGRGLVPGLGLGEMHGGMICIILRIRNGFSFYNSFSFLVSSF